MTQRNILKILDEARFLKNELGETKKAIRLCDKILRIEPDNRDAMLIKAGGLKELGEAERFLGLSKEIIEKWPEHWEAYYLLSLFSFAIEEEDKTLELMSKSLSLEENFNNVISYGQMLYLTGDQDYMTYIDKAKKIDTKRAKNFMKNHWIWDENSVQPTVAEELIAMKFVKNIRKFKK
ncbi:hypothetical protein HYX00_06480 [Candidatus Woesearchaeota archaeon]|nr:hypothetical protein [Candidatus Woesearchaeota archaeon]